MQPFEPDQQRQLDEALHDAVVEENLAATARLLKAGANPNWQDAILRENQIRPMRLKELPHRALREDCSASILVL